MRQERHNYSDMIGMRWRVPPLNPSRQRASDPRLEDRYGADAVAERRPVSAMTVSFVSNIAAATPRVALRVLVGLPRVRGYAGTLRCWNATTTWWRPEWSATRVWIGTS